MNIQGIGQAFTAYQSTGVQSRSESSGFDVESVIAEEDSNQDGYLSVEETSLSEEMFSDADTDSDGQLSLEELEEMLANGPPPMGGGGMMSGEEDEDSEDDTSITGVESTLAGLTDIESLFAEEDIDGDGYISQEESTLSEEMFSDFDADGDGLLAAEEIEAMPVNGPPPMGGGMIPEEEDEDSEDDTSISGVESTLAETLLSRLDSDQDGAISEEELEQYLAEMQEQRQMTLTQSTAMNAYQESVQSFLTSSSQEYSTLNSSGFPGLVV